MEDNIIIYDPLNLAKRKENPIFQEFNIRVYGATKESELMYLLTRNDLDVGVLVMDTCGDEEECFRLVEKVREFKVELCILLLTANNSREAFVKGLRLKINDYLLKPVTDARLVEKVLELLNKKKLGIARQLVRDNELTFDVKRYLDMELSKSKKGKYEMTILLIRLFRPDYDNSIMDDAYKRMEDLIYQKFREVLWNTDILEKYGTLRFIGLFPFCGIRNSNKVHEKLVECFEAVKKENKLAASFHLAIANVTYPTEENDAEAILEKLNNTLKKEIDNIRTILQIHKKGFV